MMPRPCELRVPQDKIARYIHISPMTLRLHFREDLEFAAVKANQAVANDLFRIASKVSACWPSSPANTGLVAEPAERTRHRSKLAVTGAACPAC
jgi:hypothetical protein